MVQELYYLKQDDFEILNMNTAYSRVIWPLIKGFPLLALALGKILLRPLLVEQERTSCRFVVRISQGACSACPSRWFWWLLTLHKDPRARLLSGGIGLSEHTPDMQDIRSADTETCMIVYMHTMEAMWFCCLRLVWIMQTCHFPPGVYWSQMPRSILMCYSIQIRANNKNTTWFPPLCHTEGIRGNTIYLAHTFV